MNWKETMGIISTVALLLPVILIFALRLYRSQCFLALAIYYFLNLCFNLMSENYIVVNADFKKIFGITNNLLEFPLMFIFITYFNYSATLARRIRYSVLIFLFFEIAVTAIFGYNKSAMTIIMAPGLSLLLFFSAWFSLRQIKITITQGKGIGKALMITALLFAYGCYMLIYVFYYIVKSEEVADIFTMYFIAATFSSLILSIGIFIENKRIKKLEELKQIRRELNMVYDKSQPVTTVSLDPSIIEKEIWN
ncbi:MAG TPA: hypothetical protein VG676_16475 [Chitinophagaceae bacterium]|jgi:hypothetical protein|nr:hypothetical protein [Chitinophagaceae bacterium]